MKLTVPLQPRAWATAITTGMDSGAVSAGATRLGMCRATQMRDLGEPVPANGTA